MIEQKSIALLSKTHSEVLDLPAPILADMLQDIALLQQIYGAAIREVRTKLEVLNDEFQVRYAHNPIHHMESRLKQLASILEKLERRGFEVNIESAMQNLTDIAGIRVICNYMDDVYQIAELLLKQDDITTIKRTDYIKTPKPNGYRSLHLVVSVPIFLSSETRRVPVEVQLRTIAMDFWASLEHQLRYKADSEVEVKEDLQRELAECAESISLIDQRMQEIYRKLHT